MNTASLHRLNSQIYPPQPRAYLAGFDGLQQSQ